MRSCSRFLLIAFICGGMLNLQMPPLQAATKRPGAQASPAPFAVIILANEVHVGHANASTGTTLYPGDALDTQPGGELRLTEAGGQIYLLSDTAVTLGRSGGVLQATLVRGTVGFSSLTDQQFQILAPEGLIEALNGPAYGQVTMTGPKDIVISAYTGELVLHRADQTLIVKPGQSYYVSLVPDAEPQDQNGNGRRRGPVYPYAYHLEWRLIVIAAAGLTGYFLWKQFSESPTDPE